mgnify:CR=1 FL=1
MQALHEEAVGRGRAGCLADREMHGRNSAYDSMLGGCLFAWSTLCTGLRTGSQQWWVHQIKCRPLHPMLAIFDIPSCT